MGFYRNERFFSFSPSHLGSPRRPPWHPAALPGFHTHGTWPFVARFGPQPAGEEQPCSCPSLSPWPEWGISDARTDRVDSWEVEVDPQPGRAMHCIAPRHFSATLNLGLPHHGDSRTLPSTRVGTFLSDANLLPTGQQVGSWFGASSTFCLGCALLWPPETQAVQAKLVFGKSGGFPRK